jgi:hypothetical protein
MAPLQQRRLAEAIAAKWWRPLFDADDVLTFSLQTIDPTSHQEREPNTQGTGNEDDRTLPREEPVPVNAKA